MNECMAEILDGFKPIGQILAPDDRQLIDMYVEQFLNGIIRTADVLKVIAVADTRHMFERKLAEAIFETLRKSTEEAGYDNAHSPQYRLMCRYTAFGFVEFSFYWLLNQEISAAEAKNVLRDIVESSMIYGAKHGHRSR